jgi:TolB-like protein
MEKSPYLCKTIRMDDRGSEQNYGNLTAAVRAELERILASSSFALSQRHRKFLSFVVEETISGRADRIKAYTIATSALGRGENFDPQRDSIVRIEAGRLRRELERYYLTEGAGASLRIEIPKGSYVPQFVTAAEARPIPAVKSHAPPPHRGPRLLVVPFERDPESTGFDGFEWAFTRQVILGLTRFSSILVFGPETARSHSTQPDLAELSTKLNVDYVLTGVAALTSGRLTVDLLLQEVPRGRFVWAERFEREFAASDFHNLREEIASLIVQRIAQPFGVLHSRSLDNDGEAPQHIRSYVSVLEYGEFLQSYDTDRLQRIREGLERAIREDPGFAEAFACLSMIESYAERFGSPPVNKMSMNLRRAIELAKNAIHLAPNSSRAHHALAMALWFSGETSESFEAYHAALSLNPFDTEVMAELGLRYAMRMDWQKALPLVQESFRRNPNQPDGYHLVPFLYHLAEGQPDEALKHARRINASKILYGHLAVAAAAGLAGQSEVARQAVANIERQFPGYGRRFNADAESRNVHPVLAKIWAEALHVAGLPGILEDREAPLEATPRRA